MINDNHVLRRKNVYKFSAAFQERKNIGENQRGMLIGDPSEKILTLLIFDLRTLEVSMLNLEVVRHELFSHCGYGALANLIIKVQKTPGKLLNGAVCRKEEVMTLGNSALLIEFDIQMIEV